MMLNDKVMWTWILPLVEERASAVDSSRPQDSRRRTGEMTLAPPARVPDRHPGKGLLW